MIGRKILVAITGVIMLLFVIVHLSGVLSVFIGPDVINVYARMLRSLGPLLTLFRVFMALVLILHVTFAVISTLTNRKAKPDRYAVKRFSFSTFAGETMICSGLLMLVLLICHILQFTLHITPDVVFGVDAQGRFDVFTMMRESLRILPISMAYMLFTAALFLHLFHGIRSVSQTVGLINDKTRPLFHIFGITISALLLLGYWTILLTALAGVGVFGK
ncbi:MAG: succinate dehydrogenase cytochrome b subunit [Syntrophorhabdaceae bacterium]|nr:succinate dehydrogenase cytochrome b subunit [Syntrophorhabdaceae bacterium]